MTQKYLLAFIKNRPEKEFVKRDGEKITINMNEQYFTLENHNDPFVPKLNENDPDNKPIPYEDIRWSSDYGIILKSNNPY